MLQPTRNREAAFGSGAQEPYANALRDPERTLYLHRLASRINGPDTFDAHPLDVNRYLAPADHVDNDVLSHFRGTVLDVGCGPGRIVQAAILAGHLALGIDVSTTAVAIAQERGLPVLHRSVFQELPAEGTWGTVVVLDGNIGIGGDPLSLLARCREVMVPNAQGRIVVEVHSDPDRHRLYDGVLVDDLSQYSSPFPWAEVGLGAVNEYAEAAGLRLVSAWRHGRRAFGAYSR